MITKISNPKNPRSPKIIHNGNKSDAAKVLNIIFLAPYFTLCQLECKQTCFSLVHAYSSQGAPNYP